MIRNIAKRFGASYIWGVINFTLGTALGSAEGSFVTQALFNHIQHHQKERTKMTWEGWPRDRLERRLKTEQTALENIGRELERWTTRKYEQTKVVIEIEQALKREEADGTS